MDSALILSKSQTGAAFLTQALSEASVDQITVLPTAGAARLALSRQDFDLLVINAPLPDEFGEALARTVAGGGVSAVLLLVKAERCDEVADQMAAYGVITLPKPIAKPLLRSALLLAGVTQARVKALRQENQKLLQKLAATRLVGQAKCALISRLDLTEPQAHRYIEKQAMDQRLTRSEVAEEILRTYGL